MADDNKRVLADDINVVKPNDIYGQKWGLCTFKCK